MVKKWTSWFKRYKRILTSDIIHIARPDGQGVDAIVHVDPSPSYTHECGLAMFFNPTSESVNVTMALPLYYAGVEPGQQVQVQQEATGTEMTGKANGRSRIPVGISLGPSSFTWHLVSCSVQL
jgi:hypothetical protein